MNAKYTYYEESGTISPAALSALMATPSRLCVRIISTNPSADSVFSKLYGGKQTPRAGV